MAIQMQTVKIATWRNFHVDISRCRKSDISTPNMSPWLGAPRQGLGSGYVQKVVTGPSRKAKAPDRGALQVIHIENELDEAADKLTNYKPYDTSGYRHIDMSF
jgi:hypothetical protein